MFSTAGLKGDGLVTLFLLSLLIIMLIVMNWTGSRRNQLLAMIPGPIPLPIIGNGIEFVKGKISIPQTLSRLLKNYDGFVKVWILLQPAILIAKPEHLKILYTDAACIDRAKPYSILADIIGNSILTSDGNEWKNLRKIFLKNFSSIPIEKLLKRILKIKIGMMERFKKQESEKSFINIKHHLQLTTYHGIEGLIFNEHLDHKSKDYLLEAVHIFAKYIFHRAFWSMAGCEKLYALGTPGKLIMDQKKFKNTNYKDFIKKEKKIFEGLKAKGRPLPDTYINTLMEDHGDNEKLLTNETFFLLLSAIDTSANTMAYALIILGLLPDMQEKVYQEVMSEHERQEGNEITVEDTNRYVLLDRVFKETLRLFPVAPVVGRRLTKDTYFGKYLVPAETDVLYSVVYANNQPEYFPEPRNFNPDRFLPENRKNIPMYAFNPFSNGPRICPGMRYAKMLMTILVSTIVKEYKIVTNYKTLDELIDNAQHEMLTIDKRGYMIRLERRDTVES